ncbi:DNA/RNA non-specific endonuclease [Xylophilus sp. GW821-FHT01B05]
MNLFHVRVAFLALALLAPGAHAAGFADCPQHFPASPPKVTAPGAQRELCFEAFAVLHSGQSKTPVYVVERLSRSSLESAQGIKRRDRFYPEARLPFANRAQLEDYKGSGYDRGHMAPAGDMPSDSAKAQSFSMANMVPQAPALNQHAWSQIEQATRKYAMRAPGDVFVFTGPYFMRPVHTIGPGQVWVPSHTWKLVYTPASGRAWAYWMENNAGRQSLKPISYEALVEHTGMRLLPGKIRED